jgi:hypothetical protein
MGFLTIIMTVAAAVYRLLPHPYNIAPVAAIALMGGMYFGRRYALWMPLVVLAVTDLVLNARMGYPVLYWPRAVDYGAFALIGGLGLWARSQHGWTKISLVAVTPFVFFLLSNLGVWLFGLGLANAPYPKTLVGLADCYAAGMPFLRGTIIGDWGFMAMFGVSLRLLRLNDSHRLPWLVAGTEA